MKKTYIPEGAKQNLTGFWHDFREFAFKGSVLDLAIGIIIGTAFNNLVQSLVKNIIMPPIGQMIGGVDFSRLYINLSSIEYETMALAEEAGAPIIKYGVFITNVIDFLILALTVFIVIKYIIRYKKKQAVA